MTALVGGRITAGFHDPRPLSNPGQHIHGALDLAGGDGIIRAPARGEAQGFAIFRGVDPAHGARTWGPPKQEKSEVLAYPWREYWQDIFGAFVVLAEPTGILHILAHIWPAQILNPHPETSPFRFAHYLEEAMSSRWPCHMLLTETAQVREGQPLAKTGSAGCSTGTHVHWEIHHQADRLDDYAARVNPERYMRDARPPR